MNSVLASKSDFPSYVKGSTWFSTKLKPNYDTDTDTVVAISLHLPLVGSPENVVIHSFITETYYPDSSLQGQLEYILSIFTNYDELIMTQNKSGLTARVLVEAMSNQDIYVSPEVEKRIHDVIGAKPLLDDGNHSQKALKLT